MNKSRRVLLAQRSLWVLYVYLLAMVTLGTATEGLNSAYHVYFQVPIENPVYRRREEVKDKLATHG